jgi:hypothetical protein
MDQSTLKWKQIDNLACISKRRPSCFKRTAKAPARELFESPKGLKNNPASTSANGVVDLTKVPCRKYVRMGVIVAILLCCQVSNSHNVSLFHCHTLVSFLYQIQMGAGPGSVVSVVIPLAPLTFLFLRNQTMDDYDCQVLARVPACRTLPGSA